LEKKKEKSTLFSEYRLSGVVHKIITVINYF
jgi:hypothetical protein